MRRLCPPRSGLQFCSLSVQLRLCCSLAKSSGDWTVAFALDNALDAAVRAQLLRSIVFAAACNRRAQLRLCQNRRAPPACSASIGLHDFSRPLIVIGLLPPLLWKASWDTLQTVAGDRCLHAPVRAIGTNEFRGVRRDDRWARFCRSSRRSSRRLIALAVVGAALFYALYMSRYTVYSHRRFQTYNFDLGQYDNIFWNCAAWAPLALHAARRIQGLELDLRDTPICRCSSCFPSTRFGRNAETLLIMQAFILGLGAIPIYLFAARRFAPLYAAVLAICYLLYPPLHGANFYDFHLQPLAATFVLFTIYFVDARRWVWCIAFVIVPSVSRRHLGRPRHARALSGPNGHRPRAGIVIAVVGHDILRDAPLRRHAVLRPKLVLRHLQGSLSKTRRSHSYRRRHADAHDQPGLRVSNVPHAGQAPLFSADQ